MSEWKKRSRCNGEDCDGARSVNLLDFAIENPSSSKLFSMTCLQLLRGSSMHKTSYCSYGFQYRKNTTIMTSIKFLSLRPCCTHSSHKHDVQSSLCAQKNSIPSGLVHDCIRRWITNHKKSNLVKTFLFLDVFSGWGSVSKAALDFETEAKSIVPGANYHVFTNDMSCKHHGHLPNIDLTLESPGSFDVLLAFAIHKVSDPDFKVRETAGVPMWLCHMQQEGIAVLMHLSFPCTTYSTASGSTHRRSKHIEAHSKLGQKHDALLSVMCKWIACRKSQSGVSGTTGPSCRSEDSGCV